jgi:tRNA pseudouridine55 synthase
MAFDFLAGEILLVDKPLKWTSFDVVNKIRYALKKKLEIKKIKVGHAGTLDPLATGLVLICTGKKTKTIEELMGCDKVYTGSITLGATTETYDLEGEIQPVAKAEFSIEAIQQKANGFLGEIDQTPPIFSAKKIDGKKAYELARKGKEVKMKSHRVSIKRFEILSAKPSKHTEEGLDCTFVVECSKGTYIRSLAHDLGQKLECGGFLSGLRRESVGEFSIDDALSIEQCIALIEGS